MDNLFKKFIRGDGFLILGFFFALLPFVLLARFDHPSADDFPYIHDGFGISFWQDQVLNYQTWQGRYFSTALLSSNPLVIRSFLLYKLIPLALMLALLHALYIFVNGFAGQYWGKRKAFVAALALLTLYLSKMSSVATGFYWFSGAVTYQMANILMLYLCAGLIRLNKAWRARHTALMALVCVVLIFAVIGSNEMSMILCLLLVLAMFCWHLYRNQRVNWSLFTLFLAAMTASYFVVAAPGNYVRLNVEGYQMQSILTVGRSSLLAGLKSIFHWISLLPMAGFTILFIPMAAQMAEKRFQQKDGVFILPFFTLNLYVGLLVTGFLSGYAMYKAGPPLRAVNVIDLFLLLGWFGNVYVCVEYVMRRYKKKFAPISRYAVTLICVFAFLSFLKEGSNIRTAYSDLLSGKAARYDRELVQRYQALAQCQTDVCEAEKLKNRPLTLYFDDITENADNWKNKRYAQYFHKKAIVLKSQEN